MLLNMLSLCSYDNEIIYIYPLRNIVRSDQFLQRTKQLSLNYLYLREVILNKDLEILILFLFN